MLKRRSFLASLLTAPAEVAFAAPTEKCEMDTFWIRNARLIHHNEIRIKTPYSYTEAFTEQTILDACAMLGLIRTGETLCANDMETCKRIVAELPFQYRSSLRPVAAAIAPLYRIKKDPEQWPWDQAF